MTTETPAPTPAAQLRDLTPAEIAAEVAGSWLTQAFANRRGDLLQLIDDMHDDPASVWDEMLTIARTELNVPEDQLELDDPVHDAIVEAADDELYAIHLDLIKVLLDEQGGLDELRSWLPRPVIRAIELELALEVPYTEPAKLRLLLEILLDAVPMRTLGY